MKYNLIYQTSIGCADQTQVFNYLTNNLVQSITFWDYFVNWSKIIATTRPMAMDLYLFDYLVGKPNIEAEFKALLVHHPQLLRLIPILLACRYNDFAILTNRTVGSFVFETFSFHPQAHLSTQEIDNAYYFADKTGLLDMFKDQHIKHIPDYVLGVEVGLDTNGRKNRSGAQMQTIVTELLSALCTARSFSFLSQASREKIIRQWKIDVGVRKIFDFAVNCNDKLYLIETNYYAGGGSKLDNVAGEYKGLYNKLSTNGHKFIWITDGFGWLKHRNSLQSAFDEIEHLLNLNMINAGILEHILVNRL